MSTSSRARRRRQQDDSPTIEPAVIGSATFAAMLETSKSTLFRRLAMGQVLKPIAQFGQQPRWCLAEVRAWIEAGMPPAAEWEDRKADKW